MKTGQPVRQLPMATRKGGLRSKYEPLFEKAAQLKNGEWLPVTFETEEQIHRLSNQAWVWRMRGFECKKMGLTYYIRKQAT